MFNEGVPLDDTLNEGVMGPPPELSPDAEEDTSNWVRIEVADPVGPVHEIWVDQNLGVKAEIDSEGEVTAYLLDPDKMAQQSMDMEEGEMDMEEMMDEGAGGAEMDMGTIENLLNQGGPPRA